MVNIFSENYNTQHCIAVTRSLGAGALVAHARGAMHNHEAMLAAVRDSFGYKTSTHTVLSR